MAQNNTSTDLRGLYPDQSFVARDVVPEALIYELTTVCGNVEGDAPALRVPYVADDGGAGFVAEGAEIAPTDPALDEIVVRTGKIAMLTRQSNEASRYADANQLIADSLARSVTVKANTALFGNSADPTGLLNVTGIADGGELGDDLDTLLAAITTVESNGGQATHISMDPITWGTVAAMKTGTGSNLPLIGAPAEQTERKLFGLPVVVSAQITEGNILVSDKREIVSAVGPLAAAVSDNYYFGNDSIARRVTWRLGWNVVRPDRLVKVTVAQD